MVSRLGSAVANRRRAASIRRLERLARGDRPIVAGPWVGDVGLELLYWVPLLRWLTIRGGVDPARVVAISRGGADPWYSEVAGRYVDLADWYLPDEPDGWQRVRDREVFEGVRESVGLDRPVWLRPALMDRLFAPRWTWGASASVVASHTEHRGLPDEGEVGLPPLPEEYAVVRASFSTAFPATGENVAAIGHTIRSLAEQTAVVLVGEQSAVSDHVALAEGGRVTDVSEHLSARRRLGRLSRLIRGARVFVSTYDGAAFIGPYVGTPTLAIYSRAPSELAHLDAIDRVGERLGGEAVRLFRARHVGTVVASRAAASTVIP